MRNELEIKINNIGLVLKNDEFGVQSGTINFVQVTLKWVRIPLVYKTQSVL